MGRVHIQYSANLRAVHSPTSSRLVIISVYLLVSSHVLFFGIWRISFCSTDNSQLSWYILRVRLYASALVYTHFWYDTQYTTNSFYVIYLFLQTDFFFNGNICMQYFRLSLSSFFWSSRIWCCYRHCDEISWNWRPVGVVLSHIVQTIYRHQAFCVTFSL